MEKVEEMNIRHILIDMDGVLTDFVSHFVKTFNFHLPPQWPKGEFSLAKIVGIEEDALWSRIAEVSPGYWANMPSTDFCDELLDIVRRSRIPFTISTSPSNDAWSASGKLLWIQRMFGRNFRNFMIGPHKHLMASADVALIDDYDKNLAAFEAHGGIAIPVPQVWNSYEGDPLAYVRGMLT